MSEAAIFYGLGGVIAGAVLTGAIDALSGWHQRNLRRRAAARIVYSDLRFARDIIESALAEDGWHDIPTFNFDDWLSYREALSDSITSQSFHAIAGTFYGLRVLAELREKATKDHFPLHSIEDSLLSVVKSEVIVVSEGNSWSDWFRVWRQARQGKDIHEEAIEPGERCLAQESAGSSRLIEATFIGPAPALVNDGAEIEMARVEVGGSRYQVGMEQVRVLSPAAAVHD